MNVGTFELPHGIERLEQAAVIDTLTEFLPTITTFCPASLISQYESPTLYLPFLTILMAAQHGMSYPPFESLCGTRLEAHSIGMSLPGLLAFVGIVGHGVAYYVAQRNMTPDYGKEEFKLINPLWSETLLFPEC